MTVDREEASALLDDVQGMEGRVRQFLIYASVSDYLFLWGTILALGFTLTYFLRPYASQLWYVLQAIGLIGTIAIVAIHHRRSESRNTFVIARAGISVVAVVAFGTLWILLTHMGWREEVTFWPTLLSFILFLVGLWLGRSIAVAALGIFVFSLTGYFVAAGPYLLLWMAVATGGSMIAGGFWLRR